MNETYRDAMRPVEERLEDLLSRMTLPEKIGQLNQIPNGTANLCDLVRVGRLGSVILANSAWAGNDRQERVFAQVVNSVQKVAVEQSRLGIPLLFARDVIHGHRTVAPIPLGQAASWSPELVREAATIAAREASADGINWTFTPMLDIARDPRWGRIAESFGEDPYLCSALARAAVEGYQGENLAHPDRIAACAKHFIGYGAAEGGRDYNTAEITDNTLHNIYLPPFKQAVESGVATVMASFNEIGGIPVSANRALLTDILRHDWKFDGLLVSDWGAIEELAFHGLAADRSECGELALKAGIDMDMCTGVYSEQLESLLAQGRIDEATIDGAVRNILRLKFRLGLFEQPYVDETRAAREHMHPDHVSSVRELAQKAVVLLKNQNQTLPLRSENIRVGVFGPLADMTGVLFGTWTLDGQPEDVVSIGESIRRRLEHGEGNRLLSVTLADDAVQAARQCDVIVAMVGESSGRSGEDNSSSTIDLPPGQEDLLRVLHSTRVPLVAVVVAGRPLSITWLEEHAAAILFSFHPGVQGGQAIASVLFGDINPGGKLPVTFPRNAGQSPIHYNHKPTGRPIPREEWRRSRYVDGPDTPLYPFGYGLSYTSFRYSNLQISRATIGPDETVEVSVLLENIGQHDGEEVVQCYIRDLAASTTRPVRELKGFRRLALAAGESTRVSFHLGPNELAFYGRHNQWCVEHGTFHVWIGGDSNATLQGEFAVVN